MAIKYVFLRETLISWAQKNKMWCHDQVPSNRNILDHVISKWAKALTSNPIIHVWSKYIEIDIHCIHDQVLLNQVTISYVSIDQISNCLTKPFIHTKFNILREKFMMTMSR